MTIDGQSVALEPGMTILEAAQRLGIEIPVLCHTPGLPPTGGCGICRVEEVRTGRLLPACATRATQEMTIRTTSAMVQEQRRAALELLLDNHRADCEAPCQLACPSRLPVHLLMHLIAAGAWQTARALARAHPFVCNDAAPCERACRRAPLDGAVAICVLHRWLAGQPAAISLPVAVDSLPRLPPFRSRMRGYDPETLLRLASEPGARRLPPETREITPEAARYEAARCLLCGCFKPEACRLRTLCAAVGARQPLPDHPNPPILRDTQDSGFHFDSSRCILCGLCVRAAAHAGHALGPAFHGRGFETRIGPPLGRTWSDLPETVLREAAAICPTGAMCWLSDLPCQPCASENPKPLTT